MATFGKRRSERVLLDVPLFIEGKAEGTQDFKEETFTLTVSAHGALIVLAAKVALGQTIRLTNLKNKDQHEGYRGVFGAAIRRIGDRGNSVQSTGAGILGHCFTSRRLEDGVVLDDSYVNGSWLRASHILEDSVDLYSYRRRKRSRRVRST